MELEEALAQSDVYSAGETEEYCMLESDTSRVVVVPDRYKTFGVEEDTNVERVKFKFPKVVGDNVDLTTLNLRINFQNASGGLDKYVVDDVEETDDGYITFSWVIQDGVTPQSGQISFVVQAVKVTTDGTIENKWSTTLNKVGQILEGLEVDETIAQQNPDIIEALLLRMDNVNNIATPEAMQGYVNQYFVDNPVDVPGGLPAGGAPGQVLTKKTDIDYDAEWKDISSSGGSGAGWTNDQITMLETLGQYLVYTDQTTGQSVLDGLISSLRESAGGTTESGNYTIVKELTNVTIDNESTSITSGSSYTANLTASDGYYIKSVTITMGGENITSSSYSGGVINIDSVTGDIVIVAIGEQTDNLIKLSECTSGNEFMPDGTVATEGTLLITPFIKVNPNTTYKTNIGKYLSDGTANYSQKIYGYGIEQDYIGKKTLQANVPYGTVSDITTAEWEYVRIMFRVENENPYFGLKGNV